MKTVLMGPPRSGKSCMREGLKQAIKNIPGAPYPYVITACPDGEGAWFQETANRDSEKARELKTDYKQSVGGFSPEFVQRIAESVTNCTLPMTLVDIGGIPSKENEVICASATHAIILAGDMSKVPEWREFCSKLGIKVIAEIHSDYHGQTDEVLTLGDDEVWKGSVHYLERGEPVAERPTIKKLAEILIENAK